MAYTPTLRDARTPAQQPSHALRKVLSLEIGDCSFATPNRYFISARLGANAESQPATAEASAQHHTSLCDEQTMTPTFASSTMSFELDLPLNGAPVLHLTAHAVGEKGGAGSASSSIVGVCQISLSTLLARDLDAEEVREAGTGVFIPQTGGRTRVGDCAYVLALRDAALGALRVLRVGVRAAVNLPLGDGGAHPVAAVALKSMRDAAARRPASAQTHPAAKGRHPVWNETLAVNFYEDDIARGERLLVAVVDDEQKQLLGRCSVPLRALEPWRRYELDVAIGKGDVRLFLHVMLEGPPVEPDRPFTADPKLAMLQVAVEGFEATVAGAGSEAVACVHLVPDAALYEVDIKQALSSGKGAPSLPSVHITDSSDAATWTRLNQEGSARQTSAPTASLSGRRAHSFLFFPSAEQLRLDNAAAIIELYTRGAVSGFPSAVGARNVAGLTPPYTLHGFVVAPLAPLLAAAAPASGQPSAALELRDLPLRVLSTASPSFAIEPVPAPSLRIRSRLWTYREPRTGGGAASRAPTAASRSAGPLPHSLAPGPGQGGQGGSPKRGGPGGPAQVVIFDEEPPTAPATRPGAGAVPAGRGLPAANGGGPQGPPPLLDIDQLLALARPPIYTPPPPPPPAVMENRATDAPVDLPPTPERSVLAEELRNKQALVERLLREGDAVRQAVRKCGAEIVELRRQNAALQAENSELKRGLSTAKADADHQKRLADLRATDATDLNSLDRDALLERCKAVMERLMLERGRSEDLTAHLARAKQDAWAKGELEKRYGELSSAHQAQAAYIQRLQGEMEKVEKYKTTIRNQEKVIEKLEQVLEQQVSMPLREQAVKAPQSSQTPTDGRTGDREREFESQRVALVMRAEKAETRLAAVENQMAENARRFGKEISVLKMRLAEKEAALAGGFGSLTHMTLEETPPAFKQAPTAPPPTHLPTLRHSSSGTRRPSSGPGPTGLEPIGPQL